jgi:hypothetical protein
LVVVLARALTDRGFSCVVVCHGVIAGLSRLSGSIQSGLLPAYSAGANLGYGFRPAISAGPPLTFYRSSHVVVSSSTLGQCLALSHGVWCRTSFALRYRRRLRIAYGPRRAKFFGFQTGSASTVML